MKRIIATSQDVNTRMKLFKQKQLVVYSFFPIDKGDCVCRNMIYEWKKKMAAMPENKRQEEMERLGNLVCSRDKTFMKRYEIYCAECGDVQGYCWATDETLTDWCDFHYAQWTDGKQWHGCFTPNISPITEQLTLECVCGNDTRDFRANMTLSSKLAQSIEESNKIGREFNSQASKFKVREVTNLNKVIDRIDKGGKI